MIGDWIEFTSKYGYGTGQIAAIEPLEGSAEPTTFSVIKYKKDGTLFYVGVSKTCVRPIPLTPEILEKNGWENSAPDVWQKEYGGLVFYWENGTRRFGMNDFRHLQEQWEIHLRIMHTHELQHALRLCGIEHEITL